MEPLYSLGGGFGMVRKTLSGLVLVLAIPATVAFAQIPSRSSVARSVSDELQAVRWGVTYAAWQRTHRQSACDQFVAPADAVIDNGIGVSELWSDRCQQARPSTEAQWFFYAFSPAAPIAHLEQFRVSVGPLPIEQLTATHDELANLLSARYGVGDQPRAGDVYEFGAAFWRNTLRWRTSQVEIYLYLDVFLGSEPRLKLLARHRALLDTLATVRRLTDEDLVHGATGTPLDAQLAKQLSTLFPGSASLLSSPQQPEQEQPLLIPALMELLGATRSSTFDRRVMLSLAADRIAERVLATERESHAWDELQKRLGGYGLTFEWDQLGGSWVYTHDLLWQIWADHRDSTWGVQAFLLLLNRGWETHVGCQSGSDQFRNVIANGEPFVRSHPRTPYRPQILLLLARSYETWWSLSLASEREEYANPHEYQPGATAARRKAITYYEELLQRHRATHEGAYARLSLPRLKLGIDTGQRQFFCVYD